MKHFEKWLYALVLILVLSMTGFAPSAEDILLKGSRDNVDYRSITPKCVFASINGASLYSEFINPIGEVRIVITDLTGSRVVRQETVLVNSNQSHTMLLSDLTRGNYIVWYYYEDTYLCGEFEI